MSKLTEELKAYKDGLKYNENTIRNLTKANKHIKEHIKFLEQQLHANGHEPAEPERVESTPPATMEEEIK